MARRLLGLVVRGLANFAMADAIQPATRNLYQKKFAFLEYRDGAGHSYAEQIRLPR